MEFAESFLTRFQRSKMRLVQVLKANARTSNPSYTVNSERTWLLGRLTSLAAVTSILKCTPQGFARDLNVEHGNGYHHFSFLGGGQWGKT